MVKSSTLVSLLDAYILAAKPRISLAGTAGMYTCAKALVFVLPQSMTISSGFTLPFGVGLTSNGVAAVAEPTSAHAILRCASLSQLVGSLPGGIGVGS